MGLEREYFVEVLVVDGWQIMACTCAFHDEDGDACSEVSVGHFQEDGLVVAGILDHLHNNFRFEMVSIDFNASFFEEIHLKEFDVW